jgi:hypothetical protein
MASVRSYSRCFQYDGETSETWSAADRASADSAWLYRERSFIDPNLGCFPGGDTESARRIIRGQNGGIAGTSWYNQCTGWYNQCTGWYNQCTGWRKQRTGWHNQHADRYNQRPGRHNQHAGGRSRIRRRRDRHRHSGNPGRDDWHGRGHRRQSLRRRVGRPHRHE